MLALLLQAVQLGEPSLMTRIAMGELCSSEGVPSPIIRPLGAQTISAASTALAPRDTAAGGRFIRGAQGRSRIVRSLATRPWVGVGTRPAAASCWSVQPWA